MLIGDKLQIMSDGEGIKATFSFFKGTVAVVKA